MASKLTIPQNQVRSKRALLIGSSQTRHMKEHIAQYSKVPLDITCVTRPGGLIADIVKIIEQLTVNSHDNYEIAFVLVGGNDPFDKQHVKRGNALEIVEDFQRLITAFQMKLSSCVVVITTILPRHTIQHNLIASRANRMLTKMAIEKRGVFIMNPDMLWKSRTKYNNEFFMKDGVHLNMRGRDMIAKLWSDFVL